MIAVGRGHKQNYIAPTVQMTRTRRKIYGTVDRAPSEMASKGQNKNCSTSDRQVVYG